MDNRENALRAYTFNKPDRIPVRFNIQISSWYNYETRDLENLIFRHKSLFPYYKKGSVDRNNLPFLDYNKKGAEHTDPWGCVWKTSQNGITGTVVKHSLSNWDNLKTFIPPNPDYYNGWGEINWKDIESNILNQKVKGKFTQLGLRHGYLFLTMSYMRGYENLLLDMFDKDERLNILIDILEKFNSKTVSKFIGLDVDMIDFPEDLGSQKRLLVSPDMFRAYLKPVYMRLMKPVKTAGKLVHMHVDGYIMDIIDDLIECGVDVINPQDLVNGIDDMQKYIKGRMAIDLDIDRQNITVQGSPKDVDDLIREEVMKLGGPEGGLALIYGLYPGTPLANAEAIMNAMEKYSTYYS